MIASFQMSYLTHASQDDDAGRHFIAPLFNAPAFDCSTSNSVRQSAESGTNFGMVSKLPPQYCTVSFACSTESAEGMASIIKLVEKLRDLQRIVLPTQVVEAPDG